MAGTIGIVDGVAMYTGDGINDAHYYLDLGGIDFSNVRVQMRIVAIEEAPTDTAGVALRFRRADESNWWEFGMNTTTNEYILRKCVAGNIYIVSEPGLTRGAGDIIKVEAYEQRINCYVNETLVISIEDTDLINETDTGMRFSAGCVLSAVDGFYSLQLIDDIRDNLTNAATYEFFVDWDQDGGLTVGDFEGSLDGWDAFGTIPPTLTQDNTYVRSGFQSMRIEWDHWNLFQFDVSGHGFNEGGFGGPEHDPPPTPFKFNQSGQGFDDGFFAVNKTDVSMVTPFVGFEVPGVRKTMTKLIPGREYTLRTWIYVPQWSTAVSFGIEGISGAVTTTEQNKWEEISFTYEATDTEHDIVIYSTDPNPTADDEAWIDQVMNIGAYEDISCYVIGDRGSIDFRYGRDQARSLASIAPGDVELELNNETQIFSPDNPGSVLAGYLAPGRLMMIRATYNDQAVNLFHGFVDNYTLHPDEGDKSVTMSAMDVLQYLANAKISTDLYPSIQTGEAMNVILDAINWPVEKRDIDQGATTVRWWWEEEANALEAVQTLLESEGMPSIAHVDAFGNFVFRSRHHRFLQTASTSVQAYIRSCKSFDEPNFSSPLTYDIGWKDIINQVKVDVDERGAADKDVVWSQQDDLISIPANETFTLNIKGSEPFYNAEIPTVANGDIVLKTGSGSISSVNMTQESGQSSTITLTAGGSKVEIKAMQVRGYPVPILKTRKVIKEDPESVALYGPQTAGNNFPWANVNDMEMISQIILGQRSERLPVVNIRVNNGHPIRISHILNRKLSDRIHLVEMEQTFMNDDYFIEVLDHSIDQTGSSHVLTIGCERARDQLLPEGEVDGPPVFTFNVTGQGFDDGYFTGGEGFTLANSLFILDQSVLGVSDGDGLGF